MSGVRQEKPPKNGAPLGPRRRVNALRFRGKANAAERARKRGRIIANTPNFQKKDRFARGGERMAERGGGGAASHAPFAGNEKDAGGEWGDGAQRDLFRLTRNGRSWMRRPAPVADDCRIASLRLRKTSVVEATPLHRAPPGTTLPPTWGSLLKSRPNFAACAHDGISRLGEKQRSAGARISSV
ncbi:hypothetical protein OUZ56_033139 [Daphnia magna]|uniref:Uncharacterized protein n=1 Tax=Daphnia magna TaxID=35525 RepID=A0ABR0BAA5_9CRUS|nr:hypothetical protein OUZ56_033139 [Daphnia magna]